MHDINLTMDKCALMLIILVCAVLGSLFVLIAFAACVVFCFKMCRQQPPNSTNVPQQMVNLTQTQTTHHQEAVQQLSSPPQQMSILSQAENEI